MKLKIDKEELYDLYIIKNLSMQEIAIKLKCNRKFISKELSRYNIKKDKEKIQSQMNENRKKKCIKKYGVENISQLDEIKEKKELASLQKYGTKNVLTSTEIRQKVKKTLLAKYGVDNPFKSKEIKEKAKKTNFKKYGVFFPSQNEIVKEKIKNTNMKKYGVSCVLCSNEIKEKIYSSCLRKYGVSNPLRSESVKNKIKETCLEKYGVEYNCMSNKCRNSCGNIISKINKKISSKLLDNQIENKLEFNLKNFSYDIKIENKNILIEINPTYTHNITLGSEFRGFKKKTLSINYHYNKTLCAKENGYRCIHIWDWDDMNKIINMLKEKEKIYARKCEIKEVSKEETRLFLEEYHLQGNCNGQEIRLGLYYNDTLVELMTFGKPRYNKRYEYELLRLCSHKDYVVVGGSIKLFNKFVEKYNPNTIVSYCDNSKFDGKIYDVLGFNLLDYGKPSKHWYNMKTKKHITDNLLRQRGFDQLFKANYGKGTSNEELMKENGFVEVYDCGQSTYVYNK